MWSQHLQFPHLLGTEGSSASHPPLAESATSRGSAQRSACQAHRCSDAARVQDHCSFYIIRISQADCELNISAFVEQALQWQRQTISKRIFTLGAASAMEKNKVGLAQK